MEFLWYQFVRVDGSIEFIPAPSIVRVDQNNSQVRVYLADGTTLAFTGTVESLFGEISTQQAALGIVSHTITWMEPTQ